MGSRMKTSLTTAPEACCSFLNPQNGGARWSSGTGRANQPILQVGTWGLRKGPFPGFHSVHTVRARTLLLHTDSPGKAVYQSNGAETWRASESPGEPAKAACWAPPQRLLCCRSLDSTEISAGLEVTPREGLGQVGAVQRARRAQCGQEEGSRLGSSCLEAGSGGPHLR